MNSSIMLTLIVLFITFILYHSITYLKDEYGYEIELVLPHFGGVLVSQKMEPNS